jgi:hypothetical protein
MIGPRMNLKKDFSDQLVYGPRFHSSMQLVIGIGAQEARNGRGWTGGFTVLATDYVWIYAEGWGDSAVAKSNISCSPASTADCWAHRSELLESDELFNPGVGLNCEDCEMGTDYAVGNNCTSFIDHIDLPEGTPPAMTLAWAEELSQVFKQR